MNKSLYPGTLILSIILVLLYKLIQVLYFFGPVEGVILAHGKDSV